MRSIQDHSYRQRGAPLDDAAMEQHVRALAVSLHPSGRAAIKAPSLHSICAPLAAARSLADDQDVLPVSLEWLLENDPTVWEIPLEMHFPEGFPWGKVPGGRSYPWRAGSHEVPFYDTDPVVWGFTARVCMALASVLRG